MEVVKITGRLGFGCSGLMGGISRSESLRLLAGAYEHGIRHFDVARSYGYGQAEAVLGEFLQDRRSEVTVTTKVGIKPAMPLGPLAAARSLAKKVTSVLPVTKSLFRKGAAALVQKAALTPQFVQQSLEESLRSLKTDYVDILLLHECDVEGVANAGVIEALQTLQRRGLIRAFGLGSSIPATERILCAYPGLLPVIQVENNPFERVFARLPLQDVPLVVTHRALGTRFAAICESLRRDDALARKCGTLVGFDVTDRHALARALLEYSLVSNPRGNVLFSSRDISHIADNATLLRGGTPPTLERLEQLAMLLTSGHAA